VFAYLSASINYACNIYNLSGSDFMAIGNLSSIILVWQEFDGRQKKCKKWFKKNLLVCMYIYRSSTLGAFRRKSQRSTKSQRSSSSADKKSNILLYILWYTIYILLVIYIVVYTSFFVFWGKYKIEKIDIFERTKIQSSEEL
jgi:hypothetical protein